MKKYNDKISSLADHLHFASDKHQEVTPVTELDPSLSVENAYYIQLYNIDRQIEDGKKITGKKIGLTSKAMQQSLGVDEPDYGHLFSDMKIDTSNPIIRTNQVLQPRVEGELAFILKKSLNGPNITVDDVLYATESIVPSIEIVDSRIQDWKITLQDTIADNGSSAFYLLGDNHFKPEEVDRVGLKMKLYKNEKLINEGNGSDVLGDPAYCVAWLANKLSEFNIHLTAGDVVLSGALSAAVSASPGDEFMCEFSEGLGNLTVKFSK